MARWGTSALSGPEVTSEHSKPPIPPIGVIRGARDVASGTALAAWFGYVILVMSWAGHRPLQPDATHPFAYQDHGTIYVSAADLRTSHLWLAAFAALLAVALLIQAAG